MIRDDDRAENLEWSSHQEQNFIKSLMEDLDSKEFIKMERNGKHDFIIQKQGNWNVSELLIQEKKQVSFGMQDQENFIMEHHLQNRLSTILER